MILIRTFLLNTSFISIDFLFFHRVKNMITGRIKCRKITNRCFPVVLFIQRDCLNQRCLFMLFRTPIKFKFYLLRPFLIFIMIVLPYFFSRNLRQSGGYLQIACQYRNIRFRIRPYLLITFVILIWPDGNCCLRLKTLFLDFQCHCLIQGYRWGQYQLIAVFLDF